MDKLWKDKLSAPIPQVEILSIYITKIYLEEFQE